MDLFDLLIRTIMMTVIQPSSVVLQYQRRKNKKAWKSCDLVAAAWQSSWGDGFPWSPLKPWGFWLHTGMEQPVCTTKQIRHSLLVTSSFWLIKRLCAFMHSEIVVWAEEACKCCRVANVIPIPISLLLHVTYHCNYIVGGQRKQG